MLELLVLGAIAVFLISRLFQVLGQKMGYEDPNLAQSLSQKLAGEPSAGPEEAVKKEVPDKVLEGKLEASIQKIKSFDPSFRTDWFLEGATHAFEMLIDAFSKGNRQPLQNLMSPEVYDSFDKALEMREQNHQRLVTTLVRIDPPEITKIKITETRAFITVRFISEQINILYAADDSILEGSPKQMEEVTDEWTFERALVSSNPNWCLSGIKS